MKKIVDLIKVYKVYILLTLLGLSYFGSCQKRVTIKKLNKNISHLNSEIDSLINLNLIVLVDENKKGFLEGIELEKNRVTNYILKSTKYPLDIRTRQLIVEITNDIENNQHRNK